MVELTPFVRLATLFFIGAAAQTFVNLARRRYRDKAWSGTDSLLALFGGAVQIYMAEIEATSLVLGGGLLFMSGLSAYSAVTWSSPSGILSPANTVPPKTKEGERTDESAPRN